MMHGARREHLYNLLPAVYRTRDVAQGGPLRALLGVIEGELELLERDVDRLYDNWFIETCDEWVVPYIGDLLGVRDLLPLQDGAFSQRGLVANTLSYRRRKGTVAMLEQMARDITGWPAKAVELFELLVTTQYLNHLRLGQSATMDLRDTDRLDLLHSPFERVSHTAEVRHIDNARGKYNTPHVGLFLWRLQSYAMEGGDPRAVADPPDGRYHFNSLGYDAPLFTRPETETEITQLAEEVNLPGPIRPAAFSSDLEDYRRRESEERLSDSTYYGPARSLNIIKDRVAISPVGVIHKDLRNWDRPPKDKVAVDVSRGRLAFADGEEPEREVKVSYSYGFSGDIGGGPYPRQQGRSNESGRGGPDTIADPGALDRLIEVPSPGIDAISAALDEWEQNDQTVIQIGDDRTYQEDLEIGVDGSEQLVIQAANGRRPTLIGDVILKGNAAGARLRLDGLLISGSLHAEGDLERLSIRHCTFVPGQRLDVDRRPQEPDQPSVVVEATNKHLELEIDKSIVGPLRVPPEVVGIDVQDSIVDSPFEPSIIPVLVSKPIPAVNLSSETPAVNVTIGDEGPYRAVFPDDQARPNTVPQARDQLQAAIQAAHDSPAFRDARVVTVPVPRFDDRLIVLPGIAASITIEAADPTASELALDPESSLQVYALLSGKLTSSFSLSSDTPSLDIVIGDEGPRTLVLSEDSANKPSTVAQARDALLRAIRTAHGTSQAFTPALVANVGDRLVVLPGAEGVTVTFSTAPNDETTLTELALESALPAIAASDGGGSPGPPTTLRRTTIFGTVHIKELTLASEVIFADPVTADRRQAGCVRFSYVPDGSRTPSRFRCQPDLEIQKELEAALRVEPSLTSAERERILNDIRARLRPSFTAVRYGEAAYAQLGMDCAEEIRTGAEDEGEMGAYNFLQQEQRTRNLRASLDAYLRFGLEAGSLFVN